ncbi:MAG: Hpt domain-containing protein, partial [Deltaproteobacteria bacterium]
MSDASGPVSKAAKDFLMEAEEITDQIGTELADLVDSVESGNLQPDLLNSIFRGAHSLKGLAGMFGFNNISELSHNMENLLDYLRLGKLNFDQNLIHTLIQSHELLASLIRSVAEGSSSSHDKEIAACIAKINACIVTPDAPASASQLSQLGMSERMQSALTEYEEHRLLDNLAKGKSIFIIHTSFDLTTFDQELSEVTDLLKSCGEVISVLPSIGEHIETNIDFDILYGTSRESDDIAGMVERNSVTVSLLGSAIPHISVSATLSPVAESSKEPANPAEQSETEIYPPQTPVFQVARPTAADDPQSAKSLSRTVRVDISKLDELMNIVGELVQAHLSISTVATKMRTEGFSHIAIELGKATKMLERKLTDLQKGVME